MTMTTDKWRLLALQFDMHRMNALELLRQVAKGEATVEDVERFLAEPPNQPTHRHRKGGEYHFIATGKIQSMLWEERRSGTDSRGPFVTYDRVDMRPVKIYRSAEDGSWWVRPKEEWEDGRFIEL